MDYSKKNRGIARGVAKRKAREEGYTRICSKPVVGNKENLSLGMKAPDTSGRKGRSWFSDMWREMV